MEFLTQKLEEMKMQLLANVSDVLSRIDEITRKAREDQEEVTCGQDSYLTLANYPALESFVFESFKWHTRSREGIMLRGKSERVTQFILAATDGSLPLSPCHTHR